MSKVGQRVTAMALALQADISPRALEQFSNRLPNKIEDALDFPVVKEMVAAAGEKTIQAYLEFELMKLANLVSVGGNLNNAQVVFIASELIRNFPNETLADFKLCFQRGAIGTYGEIFRMDGIVIRGWMQMYLDEKYQVTENKLMSEKEAYKDQYTWNGVAQTLTDEVKRQQVKDRLQEWKSAIEAANVRLSAPITDEDIKAEGQERPKAKMYPTTALSQAQKHELHLEYVRQNFDKYTADKLPGWIPEDQWIGRLSEGDKTRIYKQAKIQ